MLKSEVNDINTNTAATRVCNREGRDKTRLADQEYNKYNGSI